MSATRALSGPRSWARNREQATGVAPLPVELVPRSYLLPAGARRVPVGCSLGGQEEIGDDPVRRRSCGWSGNGFKDNLALSAESYGRWRRSPLRSPPRLLHHASHDTRGGSAQRWVKRQRGRESERKGATGQGEFFDRQTEGGGVRREEERREHRTRRFFDRRS